MKIAVVIDDEQTISQHFGRAQQYLVYTVENGDIQGCEVRHKPGHQQFASQPHEHNHHTHEHGTDVHSGHKHDQMLAPISDCAAVIVCGMGQGAYLAIEQAQMQPFITDIRQPDAAVRAYLDGTLSNHTEKLH